MMHSPNNTPVAPRQITGRFVFWALVAFFAVVAGVNVVMMMAAIRTMPGVAVKNSYEASQQYNHEIALMRGQAERGWSADAQLRLKGDAATLVVDLRDKSGAPLRDLEVVARLEHPESRALDRVTQLGMESPGRFAGRFDGVQPGARDLLIEASRDGERLFISRNRAMLKE